MSKLPAIGSKVHSITGPSVHMNGEVISHVVSEWGDFAEVRMFNGSIERLSRINDRPGIGWYLGHSVLGDCDSSQNDFWNYSNID